MEAAVSRLMQAGFTEYEAKAYIALLEENPLTAYEIAKKSGIPSSKIYEVIRKLENRRAVQAIHGERSRNFLPLPHDELIENIRSGMEMTLQSLSNTLKDVKKGMDSSYTWHIKDYEGFAIKARRMVDTARQTILLSTWAPEMDLLAESLHAAGERSVKIAAIHYGTASHRIRQLYTHPVANTIYSDRGFRGAILVCDSREALNATITSDATDAIWSMNRGFVALAEGYISHDIYQMKIMKRQGPLLKKIFGNDYNRMRDLFNDDAL